MASHYLSTLILPLFLITVWSTISGGAILVQARNLLEVTLPEIPELPHPELPEFPKVEFPGLPKPEFPTLPEILKHIFPTELPSNIPDPEKHVPSHSTTTTTATTTTP